LVGRPGLTATHMLGEVPPLHTIKFSLPSPLRSAAMTYAGLTQRLTGPADVECHPACRSDAHGGFNLTVDGVDHDPGRRLADTRQRQTPSPVMAPATLFPLGGPVS
jgi:hypothetical protein